MRNKQRFLQKIFTPNEINLAENIKHPERFIGHVAKRFAAKEAFAKALGTGIGKYLSFQDLEIFSSATGKPYFELNRKLKDFLHKNHKNPEIYLSMADEAEYAQAFVIIEEKGA